MKNRTKKTTITPFEWSVYKAALAIPLGETRSYKWVARKIGKPKAMRAVGQALRRNPFLVTIPCHRVIREDGSLASYGGGSPKRKAELLACERKIRNQLK